MLILLRRLRPLAPDKLQFKPTWMHVSDAAASPRCTPLTPLESVVLYISAAIYLSYFSAPSARNADELWLRLEAQPNPVLCASIAYECNSQLIRHFDWLPRGDKAARGHSGICNRNRLVF